MLRGLVLTALLVGAPSLASAQQPCTTDARRVVDLLYQHMLERGADANSATWVTKLQTGTTVRDIVRAIAKSREHGERFFNPGEGSVAHERAVAYLYRHILGRQPDAGGLQGYTNTAMNQGLNAVVDSIINSAEYNSTYGDWGVPGAGGIYYCGSGTTQTSTARQIRFATFDTNHDGAISRNEWRGNIRSFRVHDWNNDGVLSGDEVRIGAAPPNESLEMQDYDMEVDDRFAYLDSNNNGIVEEREWDGTIIAFDRLDRNRDGRLSQAELGAQQTASVATFATLDTNRDSRITLNEWPWSRRSFISQDTDSSGYITANEYRRGAASNVR